MKLSKHVRVRMQQRGRSEQDVNLITAYGTPTRDGYLLRRRDVDTRVRDLKKEISAIERLKNWVVIVGEEGVVVTIYPADHEKQRRMLSR